MKVKKALLLMLSLGLFFPIVATAEESGTKVGIGFREETRTPSPRPVDPAPDEPVPGNDVLPLTTGQTRYQTQATNQRSLPKTGEQKQAVLLQILGLACMACCFWLFLFTRLREEEAHE